MWSADGHNKLKKFGITLYRFMDAWSRKNLVIHVHVTNNDPRHVAIITFNLSNSLEEYLDKHQPTEVPKQFTWLATKST
jgi:hypothetical protein